MKKYDILYTYIHEKKLDYFEIVDDLEELFELRYKTQIIKAETKEQAISFLKQTQKHIVEIKNIKEIKQQNFYDKGRKL